MGRKALQFLSLRETKALFNRISDPGDKALFLIAYRHGLRVSEVCNLKVADVHLEDSRIFCRRLKGSISGFQVLDSKEKAVIQEWLKVRRSGSTKLFGYTRATVDRRIKRYGAEARLPVSKRHFHILKHSIAVHLLQAGAEIKLVQELLGHRNIQNTLIYAQLVSSYRDERQTELFASGKIA